MGLFEVSRPMFDAARRVIILIDRLPQGCAPDRQDALRQAEAVSDALSSLGYQPELVEATLNLERLREDLSLAAPAFVFNLVESLEGRGCFIHLVPALLDRLEILYTGAGADAVYLTSHKVIAKGIMEAAGIPTPAYFAPDGLLRLEGLEAEAFIVKSVWEHASIGLGDDAVVYPCGPRHLLDIMDRRRIALGGMCFAERYIEGREFNLALLGGGDRPRILPPAEIRFEDYPPGKARVVDYRAKWDESSFEYHHTQRSFTFDDADVRLLDRLEAIAYACWEAFGLKGYARVDFRVDRDGCPWVLEVNANPCLSPDAGFVAAAGRAGLELVDVVGRVVADIGVRGLGLR